MIPQRIQLKRTKGWKMPPNTVKVCRPSEFGNPYVICPPGRLELWLVRRVYADGDLLAYCSNREGAQIKAVELFKAYCLPNSPLGEMARQLLSGKNLACWCRPGEPCHADVLLEIANR